MIAALLAVLVALALVIFIPGAWCLVALVAWIVAVGFYAHSGKVTP